MSKFKVGDWIKVKCSDNYGVVTNVKDRFLRDTIYMVKVKDERGKTHENVIMSENDIEPMPLYPDRKYILGDFVIKKGDHNCKGFVFDVLPYGDFEVGQQYVVAWEDGNYQVCKDEDLYKEKYPLKNFGLTDPIEPKRKKEK